MARVYTLFLLELYSVSMKQSYGIGWLTFFYVHIWSNDVSDIVM